MLLESLREQVLHANREIARRGLAPHTFGNASGVDRSGAKPLVVIKPSGVDYSALTSAILVVTDLDGNIVEGALRPSSDLDTHTLLYREFPQIGGIVHTHSEFATSWAQAGRPIPCLGTTHADYFHGPVPVTEPLSAEEVAEAYVRSTGAVIVRRFRKGTSIPSPSPVCSSPAMPRLPGAKLPPKPSSTPTSSSTSPASPFAACSSERRKPEYRSTFPNTTTCASTARKRPTASADPPLGNRVGHSQSGSSRSVYAPAKNPLRLGFSANTPHTC